MKRYLIAFKNHNYVYPVVYGDRSPDNETHPITLVYAKAFVYFMTNLSGTRANMIIILFSINQFRLCVLVHISLMPTIARWVQL